MSFLATHFTFDLGDIFELGEFCDNESKIFFSLFFQALNLYCKDGSRGEGKLKDESRGENEALNVLPVVS